MNGIGYILVGLIMLGLGLYIAAAALPGPIHSLQTVNKDNWDKHTKTVYNLLPIAIVLFMLIILFIPLFGNNNEGEE